MLINATCPACLTRYQIQPTLGGKPMRCPNAKCRKVFVVPVDGDKPPRRDSLLPNAPRPLVPGKPQRSGNVGDLVPILPAQEIGLTPEAEPEPPVKKSKSPPPPPTSPPPSRRVEEKAEEPRPWQDGPPPVRKVKAEKTGATAKPKEKAPPPDILDDPTAAIQARSWDAPPPVRRGQEAEGEAALDAEEAEATVTDEAVTAEAPPPEPELPRRRSRTTVYAAVAALLLIVLVGLGGAAFYVWSNKEKQTASRFDEALDVYKKGGFREAAGKFHDLQQGLDDGDRKDEAQFYETLAGLRADLEDRAPGADKNARTAEALNRITTFVNDNRSKKLLLDNAHDLAETYLKVAKNWIDGAVPASDDTPLETVKQISTVKDLLASLKDGLSDDEAVKVESDLDRVRDSVAQWQRRDRALANLKRVLKSPNPLEAVKQVGRIVRKDEDVFRGQEQTIADIKTKLYDSHFAALANIYQEANFDMERPDAKEAATSALAVTPWIRGKAGKAGERVDLVAARGVLYGLERESGIFRWAMRVGLDGTVEPQRLPPGPNGRERFLVLAEDGTVVLIVDDGGALLWRYRLGESCLGRPLLVDQRVLLPTADGRIHVLDVSRGRVQGYYHLGQRLSVGGVFQKSKRLAYFPAHETCVYVINVDNHRCTNVLYTGHPGGSLRSEPLIVTPQVPGRQNQGGGYLILNETAGVHETLLRVYALPIDNRLAPPLPLKHEPRVLGWTWFSPQADDEKVAIVTDAGRLGLFGIKQADNADPDLFPLLPAETGGIRLDVLLPPDGTRAGRAQVVYARGEDVWVLANGKLQRLQIGWRPGTGRALLPGWRVPLDLGLPLHAAHVDEDRETGRAQLVLATQAAGRQECLATAVEEEAGNVRWQRQLGMVCRGVPVALGAADDPTPLLLALDEAGALFLFNPRSFDKLNPGLAQEGGERKAEPVDENPLLPPVLLPGADGQSAIEVASQGRTGKVIVRSVALDAKARDVKLTPERVLSLPAPLGGTPGIVGNRLLLPLDNGRLMVLRLPLDTSEPRRATDWRADVPGATARGHIVALGPDRFLTTDGQQAVTYWRWPESDPLPKATKKNDGVVPVTYELKAALAAAPLVVPAGKDTPLRVLVVDIEGTATILDVAADGSLNPNGGWELKGRVTSPLFLRTAPDGTARVGCVLDERRLVWLDPARDGKPQWEYLADGEVVGQPQLIEGVLVVAIRVGAFVGLDPTTGQPKGDRLASPAGAAPAISPVAFGPNRLFAPLADGTILLPERVHFAGR